MSQQIAILHAHNTFNNGSFMMLINLIWHWGKAGDQNDPLTFWIEMDGRSNLERLEQAIPAGQLRARGIRLKALPLKITSADRAPLPVKIVRLWAKFHRHPRYFRKQGIKSIIILGGDDISEYYKKWMILSDLYRIGRYSRNLHTVLAGQTIGPFTGIRQAAASRFLKRTTIYSRDTPSARYLKEKLQLPATGVHESADLCFPDLPAQQELGQNMLSRYGLRERDYICIVPGGFFSLYTHDRASYINSWTSFIAALIRDPELKGKKVVLLPHVTRPEDDRRVIRSIAGGMAKEGAKGQLVMVDDELLPQQLRAILGGGQLTISSRMHAALSTFQRRTPAIAIGYSVKYDGVIGHALQLPDLVLHSSGQLLQDADRFSRELLGKFHYVSQREHEIRKQLEERIPLLSKMALRQISDIRRKALKISAQ